MKVIVTGAAGFIGFHAARAYLGEGARVVGVDNLSDYYDVALKRARLGVLAENAGFAFAEMDIADPAAMAALTDTHGDATHILHLAAQAGVRHALTHPEDYIRTNLAGHFEVLAAARRLDRLEHLVYASSSSVYGGNTKLPFSEDDKIDRPVSLYAATKRADEGLSHAWAHLYGIPTTGLRFFTVYGPWGRPDMSAYIFTKAIFEGRPIPVFNNGDMRRDFTFIDDVVAGIRACLPRPPAGGEGTPHRVYNIGNHRSEPLMRFIEVIEGACGQKAEIDFQPMQPGDVKETYADITAIQRDFGWSPTTAIDDGIPQFVEWFREYHKI